MKKSMAIILTCVMLCSLFAVSASATQAAVDTTVLQAQSVYRVAYSESHAPFSYTDTDGNAAGMAIDMMDYMAELAGVTVEYVSLATLDEDDTTIDLNLSILRGDQLNYNSTKSDPYFQFQLMALSEDGSTSYEGAVIGHLNYSAFSNAMIEEGLAGCESKTYDSYDALQQAFVNGEIDYILATSLVVQETDQLGLLSASTDMTLDAMLKFSDSMSQAQIDAWNAMIASLDAQDVYTIMLNAALVSASNSMTSAEFLQAYTYQIVASVAVFIALFSGAILLLSMNKRRSLEKLLNIDELTGLMSEHKFKAVVRKKLVNAKPGVQYHIISFDIDNFKYINEVYGYEKGTQTIRVFAQIMREVFAEAECIARPFADNFLIFTKVKPVNGNICGKDVCLKCMDNRFHEVLGQDYRLITSAGIYEIVDKEMSLAYMIDCANIARRKGKATYNRTEWVFTEALENEIKVKNDIIASMEKGIREREFKVYYQPKINFQTERFAGAEALVRWFREDGRQFYPDQFISLFEHNGFIARLDYYVLGEVASFLARHPDMHKISVNVSGVSFAEPDLVQNFLQIIEDYGVASDRIEIEITESAIVTEFETIRYQIDALKKEGFTVSMDDFGAGLSSLNRLKDIPIDVLKIDKEFLGLNMIGQRGEAIIESIIDMTKKIEVETVAEGVETAHQVALLKNLACDTAQGYYYAKPLPEGEFLRFMKENR